MNPTDCISILLVSNNNLLMRKGLVEDSLKPSPITIPSYNVIANEKNEDALIRIINDLGISPTSYEFLCSVYQAGHKLQLVHYYCVNDWEGVFRAQKLDGHEWLSLQNTMILEKKSDKIALSEYKKKAYSDSLHA
ncbi:hypothetical protein BIT28_06860 [Photobacterium proteolyticum]|uniref:Uncharacterized protein n=1 Tax=Photobacterium proteolyticum TaxID=1903952 RepID=A0A1Q9GER9_9GAMM|nr:hypothetical protein [Photobacterium proteolyticum]OLQ72898.1 hypothetical protein BIT28_06860 [Photobacterium proteolyticum]